MDAALQSKTRSGRVYSTAARVYLTPVACPAAFRIAPLLQAALDREVSAQPDVPLGEASECTSVPKAPTSPLRGYPEAPFSLAHPSTTPLPLAPLQPAEQSKIACGDGPSSRHSAKRPHATPTHASPADPPVAWPSTKRPRTEQRKGRRQASKAKQRNKSFLEGGQKARPKNAAAYLEGEVTIPAPLNIKALPVNSSGYESRAPPKQPRQKLNLQDLLDEGGWTKVEWDGRDSKLIEDPQTKRIWAFCVGRPVDPTFDSACEDAADKIYQAGLSHKFSPEETNHKRGVDFAALNAGVFYGHGPPKPYNLLNTAHQGLVDGLLASQSIRRLATFQSSSLAFYAPKLYEKYHSQHTSILKNCPWLKPNFSRSVYAAVAFNFGPQVCTIPHFDCMNFAPGLCAVHGLGTYDHTKGGHLVLVEPKIIIEFPPGSLILIPSATVTHANTPVQPGETRVSFTQYTPGALFRYVDNGFRTQERFAKDDPDGFNAMMEKKATRWEEGLKLWPTFDELVAQAQKQ